VDLEQPERLLTDAMGPYHLDLVDVLAAFRGAASSGNRLYGTVDPHLSPEGHELLARLVEPVVAARLSASPSTRRSSPAAGS